MDIVEIIEMKIMTEVGVDLEKDSIQKILDGMMKVVVVVDLDQVQKLVLIGTGSDVTNAENTIILLNHNEIWKQNKHNKCTVSMRNRHH